MDWTLIVAFLIVTYILAVAYVRKTGRFGDHIGFYGPIMMIRTTKVRIFDVFVPYSRVLRAYGTFGVVMVVIAAVLMTLLLVLSFRLTLLVQPEPTGIYKPQNILLLPGINEYVPSTFAVWFAFFLTLAIHEFGHGVLCRIEHIRVKSAGLLYAVIPIGAFVEPDEEDAEKVRGLPKARMLGAGITNNIVVGVVCFALFIGAVGMATPLALPAIYGVYEGGPANAAGVPTQSVITEVNGIDVATRQDVSALLNATEPGDQISLTVEKDGAISSYPVTLAEWPEEITNVSGPRDSGYMGIYYYDAGAVQETVGQMFSPIGFLRFVTIPFDMSIGGQQLKVLAFATPATAYFEEPFPLFWGIVHLLFWSAWININVGIFNAIPMVPLDGGYILKEGVDRVLEPRGLGRYGQTIVFVVSWLLLSMMIGLIALPYLLHL
ncbi:MAG: site-2 protease family protein [Methanofollis liminatans]|jgi:membrane-associated protease RseP (regulator of RpoE activity)|uniref:Peptidase M50 n=1 Tax=Methanofollis liminatans DSM 4140 TaxID=28892 RepID=J1AS92_9EURY|nr:site-2 protease family protein [Methanofollis liminatans]EJG07903.1 peptidase M50 [Methanofollis liminatans DSM 4140]MDD3111772.1 site-2 protease family protein [Methanofollis liminatans]